MGGPAVTAKQRERYAEVVRLSSLRIPEGVHLTLSRQPNLLSEAGKPTLRLLCDVMSFAPGSTVTESALRASFLRLSLATHPDKAASLACLGALPSQLAVASQRVNIAHELLSTLSLPLVSPRLPTSDGGSARAGAASSSSSSSSPFGWPSWARPPAWGSTSWQRPPPAQPPPAQPPAAAQQQQPPPAARPPPPPSQQSAQQSAQQAAQQSWWAKWWSTHGAPRQQAQQQATEQMRKAEAEAKKAAEADEAARQARAAANVRAAAQAKAQVEAQRSRAASARAAAAGGGDGMRGGGGGGGGGGGVRASKRRASDVGPPPPPPPKAPRRSSGSAASDAWVAFCAANKAEVMAAGFKGGDIYAELGRRYRLRRRQSGSA